MTAPTRYRIVVRGRLSRRFASAFEGMELVPGRDETALVGVITDQAHLHGVLERTRSLGLELKSVCIVADDSPSREEEGRPNEPQPDGTAGPVTPDPLSG